MYRCCVSRSVPAVVFVLWLTVSIIAAHTTRRHSSFASAPSPASSGHIGIVAHAGASSCARGHVWPSEYEEHPHGHAPPPAAAWACGGLNGEAVSGTCADAPVAKSVRSGGMHVGAGRSVGSGARPVRVSMPKGGGDGPGSMVPTTGTAPGRKKDVRGSVASSVVRERLRMSESSMRNAERVRAVPARGCAWISNIARSCAGRRAGQSTGAHGGERGRRRGGGLPSGRTHADWTRPTSTQPELRLASKVACAWSSSCIARWRPLGPLSSSELWKNIEKTHSP